MSISLPGFLLENLTEAKIAQFIRGFCVANILCFSYYLGLVFTTPNPVPDISIESPTDIKPKERQTTLGEYQFIIMRRNIFGASNFPTTINPDNTLPLRLVGTSCVYPQTGRKICMAIVEDLRVKVQDVFELNSYPFDVGRLIEISKEYIDIINNHNRYRLYMDDELSDNQINLQEIEKTIKPTGKIKKQFEGITETSFRNYEIKRELIQEVLDDLDQHLNLGHSKPHEDGILIYGLSRSSIFRELGITNYDVVTKINGKEINSFKGAQELFDTFISKGLDNLDSLEITVKRAGLEVPLRYTAVD